jgi:hypothetical protein
MVTNIANGFGGPAKHTFALEFSTVYKNYVLRIFDGDVKAIVSSPWPLEMIRTTLDLNPSIDADDFEVVFKAYQQIARDWPGLMVIIIEEKPFLCA